MSAPVDVLRPYARDTGAFRVNNKGAAELAEALAAVFELIEASKQAVATSGVNATYHEREAVRARLRAAVARVGDAA